MAGRSSIYYVRYGTGPRAMLLFHGFGQDHTAFKGLITSKETELTFLAFDLYHHGQSHHAGGTAVSAEEWKIELSAILEKEAIERFSVLGYSIGTRYAIQTFLAFPKRTTSLVVIAPDVFGINFWYNFATNTWLGRWAFRTIVNHPRPYFVVSSILQKLAFLPAPLMRFADARMSTAEKRQQVHNTWISVRNMGSELDLLRTLLNEFRIPFMVFSSETDHLVSNTAVKKFVRKLNHGKYYELQTNHHRLLAKVIQNFRDQLISESDTPV